VGARAKIGMVVISKHKTRGRKMFGVKKTDLTKGAVIYPSPDKSPPPPSCCQHQAKAAWLSFLRSSRGTGHGGEMALSLVEPQQEY